MFRKIELTDYESCKKLVEQIHEIHCQNRPDIYKEGNPLPIEYFTRCIEDKNNFNYLYEEDNKIVGMIMAEKKINRPLSIAQERTTYFINDIVVDKNYRRQKIARKLYDLLLEQAKKEKVNSIELNVWSFNENAIKFYESLGMKVKNVKFEDIIR